MAIVHANKLGSNTRPYDTPAKGANKIQTAIDFASRGDTVLVHGIQSITPPVRLVYRENLKIGRSVSLVGAPMEWPIIDGGGVDRVIEVTGGMIPREQVLIEGFEIRNGNTRRYGRDGGGIHAIGVSSITIQNNCIHHNAAAQFGGGICVSFAGPAIGSRMDYARILNNHIHHNNALFGGGVCKHGIAATTLELHRTFLLANNRIGPRNTANRGAGVLVHFGNGLIEENEIFQNEAVVMSGFQASGAGINIRGKASIPPSVLDLYFASWRDIERWQTVKLRRNNVHHNTAADDGGGLTVEMSGAAIAEENTFEGNSSDDDDGGGIYVTLSSSLRLQQGNQIKNNAAEENGGGLHVTCGSRVVFSGDNVVEDNRTRRQAAVGTFIGGGGISVRESELTASGRLIVRNNVTGGYGGGILALTVDLAWQNSFCEQDAEVNLRGALIEENSSRLLGAGIAVIKADAQVPRRQTLIDGCIVRNNRSTGPVLGLYLFNPVNTWWFHFQPVIKNCLVEGHRGLRSAGIWIEGVGKTEPTVEGNRVNNNEWGLVLVHTRRARVVANELTGQVDANLRAELTAFSDVQQNILGSASGGGATRVGAWLLVHRGGPLVLNSIAGHREYGLLEEHTPGGASVLAPLNWWGNPGGPTAFPGPGTGTPPGDVIRQNVIWYPPLMGPLGTSSSSMLAITIPTLPPAHTQPFLMLSEFLGEVRCV